MSERLKSLLDKFSVKDAALQARIKALDERKDASGNPVAMTEAELSEISAAEAELDNLAKSLEAEQKAEARRAQVAALAAAQQAPAAKDVTGTIGQIVQPGIRAKVVQANLTPSQKFALFVYGAVRRMHEPDRNMFAHIREAGYEQFANDWEADLRQKTLTTLTSAAGGATVPTVLSTEFIQWLYPKSAFLSGNPVPIDLSVGNLTIAGGNASATASYRAENANIAYSDATFRTVALTAKNLSAITALSNELINRSPMAVDTFVQGDLQRAFVTAMDLSALRGTGASNTLTGLKSISGIGTSAAAAAVAPTIAQVETELLKALTAITNSNVPIERAQWIMAPRVALYLASQRDGNGNQAWPTMQGPNKTLKGFPVIMSTQVPTNLGAGTNESELYLVGFDHIYFGDTQQMTLDVSREATYDVSGTLNSAFSKNQTVIRLVGSHDVGVRYAAAIYLTTAVQWGA